MKVVMVGAGNVATILSRLITQNNHTISQVISRNIYHARELADKFGATYTDFAGEFDLSADLFIIATTDASLTDNFANFHTGDKLVVHTAGSVSKEVLQKMSSNYGVLYPLQSLRKELEEIPPIPFLVDGNNDGTRVWLKEFALTLSGNVSEATDEERLKLHTAAVIVSNFTNHLYAIAEDFCGKEHVNFDLLKPLIMETAHRIEHASPTEVQTGPAVRKDIHTLDKHLRTLSPHPKLRTTYMRLTDSIMNP
jgi:predicted short-subunit dehydrogenase-like oxidoreductase (DUF2520 family)